MEIQTFLPKYPTRQIGDNEFNEIYDLYNGENFNDVIFKKKEFYDLKLDSQPESKLPEKGALLKPQKIISRFLSSYTLYDELLLFHYPGTGKTCSAIGTIENILEEQKSQGERTIKKALILVNNKELLRKFTSEIIFVCTKGQYIPEIKDEEDGSDLRELQFRRGKKLVRQFYSLYTHQTFHDQVLSILPWDMVIKRYSNSVIVFDEVHNITNARVYDTYWKFLHEIQNRKILLLTGTPMKNDAYEIANVMNLILPMELQLPLEQKFDEAFFNKDFLINEENEQILIDIFKGRISYLKSQTSIKSEYIGENIPPINFFTLYPDIMSEFQYKHYKVAFKSDSGFYNKAQEASLFIYPNGSYGSAGFNTYIKRGGKRKYSAPFLNEFRNLSVLEKLEQIKQYSSKYSNVISFIINNPNQNCFVFSESITGSGAMILGLCLELFGYKRVVKGNQRRDLNYKYYSILSDEVGTDIKSVISSFNRASNNQGEFIQVLIGGQKVSEGFTFRNIQQIHIVTPHWNYSVIDQAIARGIRAFSHRNLPENTIVRIFLHVSIEISEESLNWEQFIDLRMYKTNQDKDIKIKQMEYLIKISSFDCALTYDRNVVLNGEDKSRNCEYRDCLYRCKGVSYPYTLPENELDKSTYQLYFDFDDHLDIIKLLQFIFRKQFFITLWELIDYFNNKYTQFQIFNVLDNLIQTSQVFFNKYGFISYLHEYNNIYYLSNNSISNNYLTQYYAEYPVLKAYSSMSEIIEQKQSSGITDIQESIDEISKLPFENQKQQIVLLSPFVQEAFIENSVLASELGKGSELILWVLDYYGDFIMENKDDDLNIYSTFLVNEYNIIRVFNKQTHKWSTKNKRELKHLFEISVDIPIYGIYKGKKKNFSIVDLRMIPSEKRKHEKEKRGKACSSYIKDDLVNFCVHFNIPIREAFSLEKAKRELKKVNIKLNDEKLYLQYGYWYSKTKKFLCNTLETWMKTNNLIQKL